MARIAASLRTGPNGAHAGVAHLGQPIRAADLDAVAHGHGRGGRGHGRHSDRLGRIVADGAGLRPARGFDRQNHRIQGRPERFHARSALYGFVQGWGRRINGKGHRRLLSFHAFEGAHFSCKPQGPCACVRRKNRPGTVGFSTVKDSKSLKVFVPERSLLCYRCSFVPGRFVAAIKTSVPLWPVGARGRLWEMSVTIRMPSSDSIAARLDILQAEYEAISATLAALDGPDHLQAHRLATTRLKAIRYEVVLLPCASLDHVVRKARFTALVMRAAGGFAAAVDEDLKAGRVCDTTLAFATLNALSTLETPAL